MFFKKNREKRGFTLVELLSVIVILAIILIIVLGIVRVSIKGVEETLSDAEKNVIVKAAESYALEYRGTTGENGSKDWKEEKVIAEDGEEVVSFCVTLESLVNYGYYKNDDSNFSKHIKEMAVYFEIKNGVTKTEVKPLSILEGNKCKFFIKDSSFVEGTAINDKKEIIAGDSTTDIGDFEYKVDELGNNRYSAYLNFKFDMAEILNMSRPINVAMVLDASGSMGFDSGSMTKYNNAKSSIENFALSALEEASKIKGSKFALIEYGTQAVLRRGFETTDLTGVVRTKYLGYTNTAAGVDMATSLIFNEISKEDMKDTYVILLYDGGASAMSTITYSKDINKDGKFDKYDVDENGNKIFNIKFSSVDLYSKYNNNSYNISNDVNNYANIYYKYYKNFNNPENEKSNFANFVIDDIKLSKSECTNCNGVDALISSAGFLRSLDVNLITLGYAFNNKRDNLKEISSDSDYLCVDVGYDESKGKYKYNSHKKNEKNYCYYDANTTNVNELFQGLLDNIIKYTVSLNSATLKFESLPVSDKNSAPRIYIYDKNGNRKDKVEEILDNLDKVEEDTSFSFLNNYTFEISKEFYEEKCSNIETICEINGEELFNVSYDLIYKNGSGLKDVSLATPKFNLTVISEEKVN